jgi:uncharacterized protein with NAD-binding domain and iron-sulfur cluster
MTTTSRKKIAVLGGGVGAMVAVFELTDQPGWQDDYDITLYQMGWRLGGKGASGRNAEHGERVEEHGLHIWMGFYQNAFRVMRKCYQELGRPAGTPLATWQDAFHKQDQVTLMEDINGQWRSWQLDFPPNDEVPGDGGVFLKPWDYVRELLRWAVIEIEKLPDPAVAALALASGIVGWVERMIAATVTRIEAVAGTVVETVAAVAARTVQAVEAGGRPHPAVPLHRARDLADALDDDPTKHTAAHHHALLYLLDDFIQRSLRASRGKVWEDDNLRRFLIKAALAATMARGLISDGVLFHGFDVIDRYDLTEWLQRHGLKDPQFYWSAPVRALYDLVFGYEHGDIGRPNLAAGTAIRGLLRMFFTYKGAIYWKMQAGMGDTIFTPLYEVLRRRGVKFQFFHRVDHLGLSADKRRIDTIDLGIQATVKGAGYDPLHTVKNLPCWPSRPLYEQLAEGAALKAGNYNLESAWTSWADVGRRTLRYGQDFDQVLLGISLGALPYLGGELIAASPKWQAMIEQVRTVQTQAFQVWLTRDAAGLGWVSTQPAILSTYVEPLDTWADMSHLIDREDWPADAGIKNISYFCGPFKDADAIPAPGPCPEFPKGQDQRVKDEALHFLRTAVRPLWPKATDPANPAGLDWSLLAAPPGLQGERRFDEQFWRANIDPSERYVLSVKGSTEHRLRPDQSGFDNLVLAGDWTVSGLNAGCVEAATMSGLMAARALSGRPVVIVGEKDLP